MKKILEIIAVLIWPEGECSRFHILQCWLHYYMGWKIFRPRRVSWGESTAFWTDRDWEWFRSIPDGCGPRLDPREWIKPEQGKLIEGEIADEAWQ